MIYIYLLIFGICFCLSSTFRCFVFHPLATVVNGIIDITKYIIYRKWNEAPFGEIVGYIADNGKKFGCGKTLTCADLLTSMYQRYNNKKVWCPKRKKFVKQKMLILSNVKLKKIPYINFVSFTQYTSLLEERYRKDQEEDTKTVIYAFVDEASCLLNSRSFKDNLNATMIQSILTCRHYASSLYYSSQKSKLVDALLRTVTSYYVGCDKLWRFQRLNYYDADELEYALNPTIVKPYRKTCWFVKNKSYENYDTYELLQSIDKKSKEGDFMTEEEILTHLQMPDPNADEIIHTSRKYRRAKRKLNK